MGDELRKGKKRDGRLGFSVFTKSENFCIYKSGEAREAVRMKSSRRDV